MSITQRARRIKPSPTLAITAKFKAMKAEGIDVVGFGAGEPDFDTPEHIKEAAIKAIKDGMTKYTPVGGIPELKKAIVEKFKRDNDLEYSVDQILVSPGAKYSLYLAMQVLLEEGDVIIIPAPYWVSYSDQALLADADFRLIQTTEKTGFKISAQDLQKVIDDIKNDGLNPKVFLLNSPSNPTGAAYEPEELKEIGQILVENNIWVISDEIYEFLVYDGYKHHSIVALVPALKDKAIVINGVSKTYSMTGWRIGYAAGPADVIKAMTNIQSQSTSNPTSISQAAALAALTGPQDCVEEMRKEFDKRRQYIVERLNSIPGITCFKPKGAFYVFPNVSGLFGKKYGDRVINSATDFADYLLEEAKVAVVPGAGFGNDNYVRMSYATSMEEIKRGLDRIEEAVKKLQ